MAKGRSKTERKKAGEEKQPARSNSTSVPAVQQKLEKPDDMMSRVLNGLIRYERRKRRRRFARRLCYLISAVIILVGTGFGGIQLLGEKGLGSYLKTLDFIPIGSTTSDDAETGVAKPGTRSTSTRIAEQIERPT